MGKSSILKWTWFLLATLNISTINIFPGKSNEAASNALFAIEHWCSLSYTDNKFN